MIECLEPRALEIDNDDPAQCSLWKILKLDPRIDSKVNSNRYEMARVL